jgi:hypothetical protein
MNVLPQPEAGGSSYIFYTSLGLWWRNYHRFLNSDFLLRRSFSEGINKTKEDCHQCQIMSFLKIYVSKNALGSSVDNAVANIPYRVNVYDDQTS